MSVVIPSYNRPDRLRRALDSVTNQTYENIEIVVVDDHSEEDIESVVTALSTSYDVTYLRHEENRGGNAARRTGIREATGDFVAFLDDDDTWDREKIERQVAVAQETGAGVVYAGIRHIGPNGNVDRTSIPSDHDDMTEALLYRNVVGSFSTILVSATAIEETGLPNEEFPAWQDREWYVRLSKTTEFESIEDPLVNCHKGGNDRVSMEFEVIEEAVKMFIDEFEDDIAILPYLKRKKIVATNLSNCARYALSIGEYHEARIYAKRSLSTYIFNITPILIMIASLGEGYLYNYK